MKQPKDLNLSYEEALHGMQSATMYEQTNGSDSGTPKHLRTGINAAMSDHAALVRILISKGILTEQEYIEAIRLEMNNELYLHEERAMDTTNGTIKFR